MKIKIKINLLFFLLLFSAVIYSQNNASKITGKVIGSKGEPLIGANVISSEGKTVSTDLNGYYTLTVSNNKVILTFSYTGYTSQSKSVNNQKEVNVTLKENKNELEEVVVVGYGSQKKKDVTGAISSVSTKEMLTVPTTNVNEMLRGRIAGVSVSVNSSRPGGSSSILIRGQRSLSGDNAPLYVVDGSPVSDINDLNANDIKNIEI